MENKEKYYKAFMENNGQHNEIDLGEFLGLNEDATRAIIVQLLAENKIEYMENRNCSYSLKKKEKRNRKL